MTVIISGLLASKYNNVNRLEKIARIKYDDNNRHIKRIRLYADLVICMFKKENGTVFEGVRDYGFKGQLIGTFTIDDEILDFEIVDKTLVAVGKYKVYYVDIVDYHTGNDSLIFAQPTNANNMIEGGIKSNNIKLRKGRNKVLYFYSDSIFLVDPSDRSLIKKIAPNGALHIMEANFIGPSPTSVGYVDVNELYNWDVGTRREISYIEISNSDATRRTYPLDVNSLKWDYPEDPYLSSAICYETDEDNYSYAGLVGGDVIEMKHGDTFKCRTLMKVPSGIERLIVDRFHVVALAKSNDIYIYDRKGHRVDTININSNLIDADINNALLNVIDEDGYMHLYKLIDVPSLTVKDMFFERKINEGIKNKYSYFLNTLVELNIVSTYKATDGASYKVYVTNGKDQAFECMFESGQNKNIYLPISKDNLKLMYSNHKENNMASNMEIYVHDETTDVKILAQKGYEDTGRTGEDKRNLFRNSKTFNGWVIGVDNPRSAKVLKENDQIATRYPLVMLPKKNKNLDILHLEYSKNSNPKDSIVYDGEGTEIAKSKYYTLSFLLYCPNVSKQQYFDIEVYDIKKKKVIFTKPLYTIYRGILERHSITFKLEDPNNEFDINPKVGFLIKPNYDFNSIDYMLSGMTLNEGIIENDEVIDDIENPRPKGIAKSKSEVRDIYLLNDELFFRCRSLFSGDCIKEFTLGGYENQVDIPVTIIDVTSRGKKNITPKLVARENTNYINPTYYTESSREFDKFHWYKMIIPKDDNGNVDISKLYRMRITIFSRDKHEYQTSKEFYIKDDIQLVNEKDVLVSSSDGSIRKIDTEYLNDVDNGNKDKYISNFSNVSFEGTVTGSDMYISDSNTILNGEVLDGYLTIPVQYNEYQYKKNSIIGELYIEGKKAFRKYVRQIDNLQGGLSIYYPTELLKDIITPQDYHNISRGLPPNSEVTVTGIKKNLIESEKLLAKYKINNTFQDETELIQTTGIYIPMKIKDGMKVDKMRVFIKDENNDYIVRVNPRSYRISLDKENQQVLVVIKGANWVFENAELYIVSNGVTDDTIFYDKLNSSYEVDSVPLITFDDKNNVYTGLTSRAEDIDVNVNGYTLVPGFDYSVIEPKLKHSPTLVLFRNVLPHNVKIEINFLNKGTNKVRTFRTPAKGSTNKFTMENDSLIFFKGGFEVFANNLKVPRHKVTILDSKTIQIDLPEEQLINVMVRFSFEDHPNLKEIFDNYKYNLMDSTSELYHPKNVLSKESNFDLLCKGKTSKTASKLSLLSKVKSGKGFIIDANKRDDDLVFDINLDAKEIFNQYMTENIEIDCNYLYVNDRKVTFVDPEI